MSPHAEFDDRDGPVYPEGLKLGIGRAAASDWVEGFRNAFQQELPALQVGWRRLPGVIYVSDQDLGRLGHKRQSTFRSRSQAIKQLRSAVVLLYADGVLHAEAARQSIDVPVVDVRTEAKHAGLRILARVEDKISADYPEGYTLTGEKRAITRRLGLPQPDAASFSHHAPIHLVKLGVIRPAPTVLTRLSLEHIQDMLPARIELAPVDIIER